jgi:hypothetical protein
MYGSNIRTGRTNVYREAENPKETGHSIIVATPIFLYFEERCTDTRVSNVKNHISRRHLEETHSHTQNLINSETQEFPVYTRMGRNVNL